MEGGGDGNGAVQACVSTFVSEKHWIILGKP